MTYWSEFYDDIPDNNIAPPPNGAPEGHFPDQLNNIQRQAMAAASEMQQLVLGPGDGSAPPQSAPTGINNDFLKIIYDSMLPAGTMQAWNSLGGTVPFPVPSGAAFTSVVWQICDGTNGTPDLRRKVLRGGDPDNASPVYTGDVLGDNTTSADGGFTQSGTVEDHVLTKAECPSALIEITDNNHIHPDYATGASDASVNATSPTQTRLENLRFNDETPSTPQSSNLTIVDNGADQPHDHSFTGSVEPDHTHTIDPEGTSIEIYQRIA